MRAPPGALPALAVLLAGLSAAPSRGQPYGEKGISVPDHGF